MENNRNRVQFTRLGSGKQCWNSPMDATILGSVVHMYSDWKLRTDMPTSVSITRCVQRFEELQYIGANDELFSEDNKSIGYPMSASFDSRWNNKSAETRATAHYPKVFGECYWCGMWCEPFTFYFVLTWKNQIIQLVDSNNFPSQDCYKLLKKYEDSYTEVINSMKMGNTTPWTCSTTYIFGISNKFQDRIKKVVVTPIYFSFSLTSYQNETNNFQ